MKLTAEDIMALLEFVLSTTYFFYNGEIYRQIWEAPMWSLVSVVVLNLYMEDHEGTAVATAPPEMKPKIWKRYVDNSFEIIKKDQRNPFTHYLSSIDPTGSIKFTDEPEVEKTIPFLDAQITRKYYGTLKVKVYRKKTHTNQYLNFKSHCPIPHKLGVVRILYESADNIIT